MRPFAWSAVLAEAGSARPTRFLEISLRVAVEPILMLARSIGHRAADINASLEQSVTNTLALAGLQTTIDSASAITDGLTRGRAKLGG